MNLLDEVNARIRRSIDGESSEKTLQHFRNLSSVKVTLLELGLGVRWDGT